MRWNVGAQAADHGWVACGSQSAKLFAVWSAFELDLLKVRQPLMI